MKHIKEYKDGVLIHEWDYEPGDYLNHLTDYHIIVLCDYCLQQGKRFPFHEWRYKEGDVLDNWDACVDDAILHGGDATGHPQWEYYHQRIKQSTRR